MLPRKYLFGAMLTALLALAAAVGPVSQAKKQRGNLPPPNLPPSVVVEPEMTHITVCQNDPAQSTARLQLRAAGNSPQGRALIYRWTARDETGANVGRLENANTATPTWDLTGVPPGKYRATVEVDSSSIAGEGCMAFASAFVVIRECLPPRPVCPSISRTCPDTVKVGTPVVFTAEATGGTPGVTPTYQWTVTGGQITSGQGTTSITVDTTGMGGKTITANFDVLGYHKPCPASCTVSVLPDEPVKVFDVYNDITYNNEKARLDDFVIWLQSHPGARGYILAYPGTRSRAGRARMRANRARDYIVNERGLEATRIDVLEGPTRDILTLELRGVEAGQPAPRP